MFGTITHDGDGNVVLTWENGTKEVCPSHLLTADAWSIANLFDYVCGLPILTAEKDGEFVHITADDDRAKFGSAV